MKWWDRVEKLAMSHAPLQQSIKLYNVAAVTCLGYVGQLYEPHEGILQKEFQAIHKLLRVAPSSFAKPDVFAISQWSNIEVPNGIEAFLAATMWRTATTTISSWRTALQRLRDTAYEELSVVQANQGVWCHECWAIRTAIVQRFDGIANSTFFPECKGSHFLRLLRIAGPRPRARAAMIASHKRAARAGTRSFLDAGPSRSSSSPQSMYLKTLRENLYIYTMADTIKRRLLAWFPSLQPSRPPVQDSERDMLDGSIKPDLL